MRGQRYVYETHNPVSDISKVDLAVGREETRI
jgi:hypothetical protein